MPTEARLRMPTPGFEGEGARYAGKPSGENSVFPAPCPFSHQIETLFSTEQRNLMEANRRKDSLTPLRDILSALLSDSQLPFNPEDATIWKIWDEVVGPGIARNAQPLWIKDRRLRVKVSDPIWLQELSYLEASVRQKLNARLGRQAVEKIEFRLSSR
jgi:predicted nucleic acid-binding Zn ribbon protein